jgi:OmpA-OmpF porin, OOP family
MKLLICLLLIGAGCASRPEPAAISKAAGPEAAITAQQEVLEEAHRNHVDVLSPVAFKESNKFWEKAKKQKDDKDIYESLGISKAYLLEAQAETNARSLDLREVVDARNEAITAGADFEALDSADDDLIKFTKDSDDYKEMKTADKNKITAKYLKVELAAIKTSKLAEIKSTLEVAQSKGAQTLVPKTYRTAMMRYRAAEKAIETDRHSQNHYQPAVSAAAESANRTLSLVETAAVTQNQTPEQRALTLDARNKALRDADEMNAEVTEAGLQKDEALAAQGASLTAVARERNELKLKETQDQAVTDAAARFDSSEAEVYRQGQNLVIRLKQVNFASGRSDLPAQSMPVLGKVKAVLQDLHPKNVTIEGHTDAVGTASKNQTLSEKRAAAVAKYFESDSALSGNHFDTAGFGFSKPLTSNKTREGRAQNRRVDIIITPGQQL